MGRARMVAGLPAGGAASGAALRRGHQSAKGDACALPESDMEFPYSLSRLYVAAPAPPVASSPTLFAGTWSWPSHCRTSQRD